VGNGPTSSQPEAPDNGGEAPISPRLTFRGFSLKPEGRYRHNLLRRSTGLIEATPSGFGAVAGELPPARRARAWPETSPTCTGEGWLYLARVMDLSPAW
jgi:hypothetical protein